MGPKVVKKVVREPQSKFFKRLKTTGLVVRNQIMRYIFSHGKNISGTFLEIDL